MQSRLVCVFPAVNTCCIFHRVSEQFLVFQRLIGSMFLLRAAYGLISFTMTFRSLFIYYLFIYLLVDLVALLFVYFFIFLIEKYLIILRHKEFTIVMILRNGTRIEIFTNFIVCNTFMQHLCGISVVRQTDQ